MDRGIIEYFARKTQDGATAGASLFIGLLAVLSGASVGFDWRPELASRSHRCSTLQAPLRKWLVFGSIGFLCVELIAGAIVAATFSMAPLDLRLPVCALSWYCVVTELIEGATVAANISMLSGMKLPICAQIGLIAGYRKPTAATLAFLLLVKLLICLTFNWISGALMSVQLEVVTFDSAETLALIQLEAFAPTQSEFQATANLPQREQSPRRMTANLLSAKMDGII
nr:hypothetical protein Iba_chr14bCG16570 [Ipomoea batatas]